MFEERINNPFHSRTPSHTKALTIHSFSDSFSNTRYRFSYDGL